jgi:hypothetical protein
MIELLPKVDKIKIHVLKLEEYMFGLTPTDLHAAAYRFAVRNTIPTIFNAETKFSGEKSYCSFMKSFSISKI